MGEVNENVLVRKKNIPGMCVYVCMCLCVGGELI